MHWRTRFLTFVETMLFLQVLVGNAQHLAIAVCSRSSTKAVVITVVHRKTASEHGVL